ncbi:histidinol-phosphate transaminase [Paraurantiacibacter namhicola]|uniref:Histidinol-phosphate aminotransferase n=1 Tax=Paraurantiacibacter namhicola TaxID=645517 RepID=A0A1C7D6U3_9SPHN|nr:histidinol-phosphate transaminase [Paraurantiacibacter namhicola]ANU07072.1 Histidinol-phosphate aminotransferase 2 [Paraurantiacibacter namhicola]
MTDTRPVLKPWIEQIHAYVPGRSKGAGGRELVKLSANENPLGCSPLAAAARAELPSPDRYPDPDSAALREKIAAVHGLDPARVVCGTGSGELLHCAVQAYAGPGDEVLFSRYAFSLYPLLAQKVGAVPVMAEAADYAASVDNLLAAVTQRTRVVLLDNPNNPTGTFLPAAEVARLHAALAPDVLLVVDQAYAEYLEPGDDDGGLALAQAHENVIVSRTFSKAYGLAGDRVGWATGAPGIVDALNRLRGAFNVPMTAQLAAMAALDDPAFVRASREHNSAERARFVAVMEGLSNHGLRVLPSEGNFVLVLFEGALDAAAALDGLADAGYAVRHLPGQGLPHGLRITIGTAQDMDAIAETLRRLAEQAA